MISPVATPVNRINNANPRPQNVFNDDEAHMDQGQIRDQMMVDQMVDNPMQAMANAP